MLFEKIQADLKEAQLQKDEIRTSVLRMLISEMRYAEIRQREGEEKQLSDDEIISVVQKEIKKRKEASAGFRQGGREDAALKEEKEAEILMVYLPKQLSDEELGKIIDEAISQTGASNMADMGKVIGIVMGKAPGQADGSRVSALVKSKLNG
ncbi:MAG: GatB/YqeY domain-containing protein [Candidatus Daviesbacteria bacterium]|nr:GatB/YqeY domain-containing protein [Candidatus Daviesbacteria bacterium]